MIRHAWIAALLLVGCSSCGSGSSSNGGSEGAQRQDFANWTIPGLRLQTECIDVPDRSTCAVIGIDEDDHEVRGADLWRRLPSGLSPRDLAIRAHGILLGEAHQEPLGSATDRSTTSFVSEQEWTVIRDPMVEGGVLTFFTIEGEMHPTAMRVRVDPSGAVTREQAIEIWAATVTPDTPASCEPISSCGCPQGCASVFLVEVPRQQGGRYRRADDATVFYYRDEATGVLVLALEEECTESCRLAAPSYTCELRDGGCVQVPRQ